MTIINLKDFEHIPEKSFYNNNFYKHKSSNTDTIIFVNTNEEYNTEHVFISDGNQQVFLGSCQYSDDDVLELNIGEMYT